MAERLRGNKSIKIMKIKNMYWLLGGIVNLLTAFLHLIGGQQTLIQPLLQSNLKEQVQTELLGVWHMVTIILFAISIIFLKNSLGERRAKSADLIAFVSYLYIAFSFSFILSSVFKSIFAPQWILLFPIGVLGIIGLRKSNS